MEKREHPYVALARRAIEHFLETRRVLRPDAEPGDPPPTGLFVSLHGPPQHCEPEGQLRGCVGSTAATEPNLRREIARIAVSAATSDPRFPPLTKSELADLDIKVYLLGEPEMINDLSDLDPTRYGVILRDSGGRTGLLLPAIAGIDTPEQQVAIARQKGRFRSDEEVPIYRFEAEILH